MATIPSADELGIRAPQATTRGVKAGQVSLRKDLAAVETTAAQKGMKELEERIANEELANAEVQFQIGAMAESKKYENDNDFETIEERHAAGMTDQLAKAAANITSAKTRELFMIRGEEGVARANAAMNDKVTRKKNDREKGYMANAIDLMVKGGMDLEYGDPGEAALGIQLSLDSMVERGVISNVDAQSTLRKAQLDMAYGRLKAMTPEQQLEILSSEDPGTLAWLEQVPPDVIRQLKEQAEEQGMDNEAQSYAMSTRGMDSGDALNQMYADAGEGQWDAERIDATRMRILRLQQDDEVIKQKALEDYYEEGAASIYFGETTLEQLESTPAGIDMLKKLSENQRRNLRQAQDNAILRQNGEGRKYSDGQIKSRLKDMLANGQEIEARKYWSENYASLNDADFKYFDSRTSPKKSADPSFKPLQTTNQIMSDYLEAHPLDEAGEKKLWDDLAVQAEQFYTETGKNPERAMVQQWVRDKHAAIVLEPPTTFLGFEFFGETVLERDLTPEQRAEVKPITNVYQAAGMTGEQAAAQFSGLSAPERAEFRRKRLQNPDMPALEFLARFKRGINAAKAKADLHRRQGSRGGAEYVIEDAGA